MPLNLALILWRCVIVVVGWWCGAMIVGGGVVVAAYIDSEFTIVYYIYNGELPRNYD